MRVDLTKSVVDSLSCPEGKKDILAFDLKLSGFALRVTSKGTKVFLVQYSRGGKTKRIVLGHMGVITPAEARRKALALIGDIQGGGDPFEARKARHQAAIVQKAEAERQAAAQRQADQFTVSKLLDAWQSIKLKDHSESYKTEGPRGVRRLLGRLEASPASSITTAIVQAIVDREIERAPAQTIDARSYGRAAWNWAMTRGLVQSNPFTEAVIERRVKSRDRVLTDHELVGAWRSALTRPYPFGPAVQLLILTLQRLSEVMGLQWSELSSDFYTWTIPAARSKNRKSHVVHLSEPSRAILLQLKCRREMLIADAATRREAGEKISEVSLSAESDFVFTTTGKTPVSGTSKARRALDPEAAEDSAIATQGERHSPPPDKSPQKHATVVRADWRFHDFRRTGVSKLAELGIQPHVADRILNHVTGSIQGVAAVYQRFEFLPERKRALDIWAAYILSLASNSASSSNVVALPGPLKRSRRPAA